MRPSSREVMLEHVRQRYPTFSQAAAAFSSTLQPLLLNDLEKVYSEKSPVISDLDRMYSPGSSALWVKTQLLTIDFTSSVKEGADMSALEEFSKLFAAQYHYIKLTEFLSFVARFKLGRYGKFYGYFDTMIIGEAFRRFLKERSDELDTVIRRRKPPETEVKVERNHEMPDYLKRIPSWGRKKKS